MNETRNRLRLLLELLDELGIVTVLLEHDLDGNRPIKHLVASHVDAAHAARPELALEQEVFVLSKDSGSLNQRFAHLMILHPLIGQNTTDAHPRRFSAGTGPQ